MSDKQDVKDLSFRDAGRELEEIVRELEQNDLELEVALDKYARGVELLRELKARLNGAEQQVQTLLAQTSEVSVSDTTSAASTSSLLD